MSITASQAVQLAAAGKINLLDVRETGEVMMSGRAAGAHHIPLGLVPVKADPKAPDHPADLSVDKPIAVYCASGARSGRATEILRSMGYKDVHNIGGLAHWKAAGGQVVR
ncbi:rhodanese-like domain-containing protein [Limimaricola sp.]|uniref:rhodanese-like domain-containing protein n=1 Tax=Limimaricola sp. TaxID=2211665 RepID=UPI0025C63B6F|nr:rhodanese-like domain-containing protein [Limimaricola sp.]